MIKRKMPKIKKSNVDPVELSELLLASDIIGTGDAQRAWCTDKLASERLGELFLKIMGNGAPGTFQKLVDILLDKGEWKWLGSQLKGTVSSP